MRLDLFAAGGEERAALVREEFGTKLWPGRKDPVPVKVRRRVVRGSRRGTDPSVTQAQWRRCRTVRTTWPLCQQRDLTEPTFMEQRT